MGDVSRKQIHWYFLRGSRAAVVVFFSFFPIPKLCIVSFPT